MPVVTCVTATGDLVTLHLPPGLHHPDMAAVVDTLLQVGGYTHCRVQTAVCAGQGLLQQAGAALQIRQTAVQTEEHRLCAGPSCGQRHSQHCSQKPWQEVQRIHSR